MATIKTYIWNHIGKSMLTGEPRYYFIPKAEVLSNGMLRVVGKRIDVTDSINGILAATKRKRK